MNDDDHEIGRWRIFVDTEAYQNARDALQAQDYKAAERAFKKALESIDGQDELYNSVLSYYGLCQVLNSDANGLLMCRDAASNEVSHGEVFLNLACAEWHSDNRKRAIDAISHGIKIDADNAQLNRACAKLECRRKCCFAFLPRGHKFNRMFGRLFRRDTPSVGVHDLLY
jgi:tetratricopeptide (TPR) repeat protein